MVINRQLFVLEMFCCYWCGPLEHSSALFDSLSKETQSHTADFQALLLKLNNTAFHWHPGTRRGPHVTYLIEFTLEVKTLAPAAGLSGISGPALTTHLSL